MVFIAMAIMYHGLILMILSRISKIGDAQMYLNGDENKLSNSIIRWDRSMFIIYVIIFALVNVAYFIHYYE